jgi:hypothetical protein
MRGVESAYASKQSGTHVWFVVFTSFSSEPVITAAMAQYFSPWSSQLDRQDHTSTEELLGTSCKRMRRALDRIARVALDIHDPDQAVLLRNQKDLIMACSNGRLDSDRLGPYLELHSPLYRSFSKHARSAFWRDITHNCLSYPIDVGHWLFNIVLGGDSCPGWDPAQMAAFVGIAWPP